MPDCADKEGEKVIKARPYFLFPFSHELFFAFFETVQDKEYIQFDSMEKARKLIKDVHAYFRSPFLATKVNGDYLLSYDEEFSYVLSILLVNPSEWKEANARAVFFKRLELLRNDVGLEEVSKQAQAITFPVIFLLREVNSWWSELFEGAIMLTKDVYAVNVNRGR